MSIGPLGAAINPLELTDVGSSAPTAEVADAPLQYVGEQHLRKPLDRQVVNGQALQRCVLNDLKALLGPLGLDDAQVSTLLAELSDTQFEELRRLGRFESGEFVRLLERLDDKTLEQLSDTSRIGDAELASLMNAIASEDECQGFDPGAWERHTGVLLAAIIALNIARVAVAQLRGHFSVMTANAAVEQGKAIREGAQAGLYAAIGAAVLTSSLSLTGLAMTFKGGQGKLQALAESKPEIAKGMEIRADRLMTMGASVSSFSQVLSNVLSTAVRLEESVQREREVLQQSNQNVQKSLGDEEGQTDASNAALLQKLMEIMQQISQSRNSLIDAMSGRV